MSPCKKINRSHTHTHTDTDRVSPCERETQPVGPDDTQITDTQITDLTNTCDVYRPSPRVVSPCERETQPVGPDDTQITDTQITDLTNTCDMCIARPHGLCPRVNVKPNPWGRTTHRSQI